MIIRKAYYAGIALTVIGVVLAAACAISILKMCMSYGWPSVSGKVVSLDYQKTGYKRQMSVCSMLYEYSVQDKQYASRRYSLAEPNYRESSSKSSVATGPYKQGEKVLVYYNPKNPDLSVLMRGPNWIYNGSQFLFSVSILGLGVTILRKQKDELPHVN